jgi:hypothetical protein
MSRPLRIQFPQAIYHVMNRGAARQPTFADEGDYQAFLDTGAEAHWLWGIETVKHRVKSLACVFTRDDFMSPPLGFSFLGRAVL